MADKGPETLAAYVRQRRLRAGLSQEALAERAGLTVDTVGALERGLRRRLYPHTARALADALGLKDAELAEMIELARGRSVPRTGVAAPTPAAVSPSQVATSAPPGNLPAPLTSFVGRE